MTSNSKNISGDEGYNYDGQNIKVRTILLMLWNLYELENFTIYFAVLS